jgi:hypothetical protein
MEVTTFVEMHADLTDEAGRRRIVRHGYLPKREIQTGIGLVAVRCPRVYARRIRLSWPKPSARWHLDEGAPRRREGGPGDVIHVRFIR